MKISRSRWKKISISIALFLLLSILALIIFRNTITKSLITSFASKQNIDLSIDKLNVSFRGRICIINPQIKFQKTYLNANKSIELTALTFDTIYVHGFSYRDLIFNSIYCVDSLVFNKPDFSIQGQLAQKTNKTKADAFNLEHLLAIMGQEPNTDIKQKVKIGEIRFDYGMANIRPVKDSGNAADVVDFEISIKDFSTLAEDLKKPGRIFFSDDIQIEVKNIKKVMISGYDIDMGKLFISVKKNILKITDVDLFPANLSDSTNQIALAANLIELNGLSLNELSGKEEVQLSSVHISNGHFITNTHHRNTDGRKIHNDEFKKFANDIIAFKLDTLGIHNFDLRFLEYLKDTISYVQDFNIELYGFALDSSMLDDIYREVAFEEFIMSSGTGAYKIESDGIMISLDSSKYTSVSEVADFYQLRISDSKSPNDLDVSAGKISIAGLAQELVPYPDKLQLTFTIEDVQAKLNLGHQIFQKKSQGGSMSLFDLVNISRLDLLNANIDLSNDHKFDLQLHGLDITSNNPLLVSEAKIIPNLSELSLEARSMTFSSGNNISGSSGSISYAQEDFRINQMSLRYKKAAATSRLQLAYLSLDDILLTELIEDKKLSINKITLGSTQLTGDFDFTAHQGKEQKSNDATMPLPFESISIGEFNLRDLQINNQLLLAGEEIPIQSNIDIQLKDFEHIGPEFKLSEIAGIKGKLSFSASSPDIFGHSFSLGDLTLDISNEKFDIKDLSIKYFEEEGKTNDIINKLELSLMQFDRLNYAMLLQEERLQFHKFKLRNLALDMVLHPKRTEKQKEAKKEFDINDYVQLDTTQVVLENIDLNIEIKGDSSGPVISLHDLDLNYAQSEKVEVNFMSGIDFSFEDFGFNDHIKHSNFSIESGNFNSRDYTLRLINISGGNLKNEVTTNENTKGWSYASSELLAKNIFIRNTLPSRISMDKLAIQGSKLVISSEKQKEKKGSLKLDLEAFYEFGNFMTKFSIDTTVFSEIKVHYKSFDDTTSHIYVADSIGLTLHSIKLDSTAIEEKHFGIIKQMNIDFKGRTSVTKDSLYEISSGLLSYDFQREIISIDSFRLAPRYEGDEFYKRAVYQTDRMDIFGQQINLHGLQLEELLKNDIIHFGWIDIDSLNLEMVRDKRYPLKGDYKAMPQQMLASLSQKILIDSVSVRNSYMKYGEYDKKSVLPGTVFFDRFNLDIQNITNIPLLAENNNSIKLSLNAYLMGKARLDLDMGISYVGSDSNFWFSATTEQLDLTTLNPLTENLLGITIRSGSGRIQESSVSANSVSSKGSMIFTYKKMKLGLYNRSKDHENKGMFAGITRFLINDLIIASNNPKFARKPKTGEIYFKRDVQKSFINYTWKSLLSGIMSTAGFNNKEQRQEKKEMKGR